MPEHRKDKRRFKRYCKKSNIKFNIDGKTFNAEALDYSFDGIGAFVEDTPPLSVGAVISVSGAFSTASTKWKIIWTKKTGNGMRVGINCFEALKKGLLKNYPLPDILIGLQRSGLTGVLEVKSGAVIKKVYIKNGDIIFSTSDQQDDQLGEYLFRMHELTVEQHSQYTEKKKTGKKEGAILVELSFIRPQELPELIRRLCSEIITSLFAFEEGSFEFKEGILPSDEVITLKLSAADIIYRGIKRIADSQRILDFSYLPKNAILCFSSDPLNLFQDISFETADKRILSYVDGKTTIKEIIDVSPLKESETLKAIYALLSTKIIELKEEAGVQSGPSADEVIEEPVSKVSEEFMDRVEGIYSTYESLGYYGILGVKDWATPEDIKKAFYKAAKEFHPDRHFHLKSDTVKEKLNTIFSYVTTAYSTLSDPQKRKEYDNLRSQRIKGTASNAEMANMKFKEGGKEFKKGNYQEAFQLFGQAVYFDNAIPEYHYYYGLSLVKLKRFKEAERAVTRALEHAPSNVDYLIMLGNIYLHLNLPNRARSTFEKAIKIDPSNKMALAGLKKIEG